MPTIADPPPPPWRCSGQITLALLRADRPATLDVQSWSERFGFRVVSTPFAVHTAAFDAVIRPPRMLDATEERQT